VKNAVYLTNETGRDGMRMSPAQVTFAVLVLRDQKRRERMDMAEAMAAALSGNKELWEHIAR
jgi:hypothetical protein